MRAAALAAQGLPQGAAEQRMVIRDDDGDVRRHSFPRKAAAPHPRPSVIVLTKGFTKKGCVARKKISCSTAATTLSFLSACRGLRAVDVTGCSKLVSLAGLEGKADLEFLRVVGSGLGDLNPLAGLTGLEDLQIARTKIADLSPLREARKLRRLDAGSTQVYDLRPLAGLTNLEQISLMRTPVSDLAPLRNLTALRSLGIVRTRVVDLAPLAGLPHLETLVLEQTEVRDLRPLHRVNSLRTLVLSRSVPAEEIAALAKAQPLLKISVVDN